MRPGTHILRAVTPDPAGAGGGHQRDNVLEALAEHHGAPCGKTCIDQLIAAGQLVQYGKKRGARWGLPKANLGARRT